MLSIYFICQERFPKAASHLSHRLHTTVQIQNRHWRDESQTGEWPERCTGYRRAPSLCCVAKQGWTCSQLPAWPVASASVTPNDLVLPQLGFPDYRAASTFELISTYKPQSWNPSLKHPSFLLRAIQSNMPFSLPETLTGICSFWGNHPLTVHRLATRTLRLLYPQVFTPW